MSEKKATDLLVEIDEKIDQILSYIKVQDFNYKILLNRVNSLIEKSEAFKGGAAAVPAPAAAAPPPFSVTAPKEEVEFVVEPEPEKKKFNPEGSVKKVPVQQKVIYPDDSLVCLARVDILSNGELVKQVRTVQTGKWNAALLPGEYEVRISKSATKTKPQVNISYNIKVPESSNTVEIETKKVSA